MKYDGENAYVLFACNLHKERNSMRMIAVAADKVTLYAIIGNEVLHGNMDYKGYAKQKGFNLMREDYKRGEISSANLDYGYIEETAVMNTDMPICQVKLKRFITGSIWRIPNMRAWEQANS